MLAFFAWFGGGEWSLDRQRRSHRGAAAAQVDQRA
jgi:hypothetical protein